MQQIAPLTFPGKIAFVWGYLPKAVDVIVYQRFFLFFKGSGIVYNYSLYNYSLYKKRFSWRVIRYLVTNLLKIKLIRYDNLIFILDEWSDGPYHFFIDLLGKIIAAGKRGMRTSEMVLILPQKKYIQNSAIPFLSELGFEFKNIICVNPDHIYCNVGRSFFISLPHKMGSNNPDIIQDIQKRIFLKEFFYDNKPQNKIYYFRKNRRRLVVNEDEVQYLLLEKGFCCTDFDELSYLDAWRLMAGATLFVGIHGAGMTNMIFMPKGGTVVEFRTDNPNPRSHCYWHLAHSLGHKYFHFIAQSATPGNNIIEGSIGCDIWVDINDLRDLLSTFGI